MVETRTVRITSSEMADIEQNAATRLEQTPFNPGTPDYLLQFAKIREFQVNLLLNQRGLHFGHSYSYGTEAGDMVYRQEWRETSPFEEVI